MDKDKRNVNYIFRMTREERDDLHSLSSSADMKSSEFLRMLISNYKKSNENVYTNNENHEENVYTFNDNNENNDENVYTNLDFESFDEDFEW